MKNKFAKLLNSVSKRFGYRFTKIQNRDWCDDFVGLSDFEKKTFGLNINLIDSFNDFFL